MLLLLSALPAFARQTLVFATYPDSDTPNIVLARAVITEAYDRLGMDIKLQYMPGYRMLKKANNVGVDGLLFNVPDIGAPYSNLIRVDTPVFHSRIMAFTKNASMPITDWNSLQPYRIGYVRGFLLAEERTKDMRTEALDEQEDMLLMLARGRIDVAVDSYLTGIFTIKKLGLQGIKPAGSPLEYRTPFHYLNRKHENLVPRVEEVLSTMEQEGTIQAMRNTIVHQLLGEN